ncbi:DUF1007 family protein [Psychromonas sp. RZ22]|uniref:DUF1007 family protein n=1 Tax=Psychromonas algarum TaxID=2555643 RepID=UPI0010678BDA|nr:DUF1007 family protein [Psychromonas sp. RZ22]TEW56496.1 DUF1007 family protein [Psychromonas sp. RZ22]
MRITALLFMPFSLKKIIPLFILLLPVMVSAHPHSWVDTNTYIDSDDTHITSLHMTWTFDVDTSHYMLQGEDISPENIKKTLQALADSVTNNMYNEHYFTYLYDASQPVRYKAARYPQLIQDKDKLVLSFEIPLSKPIAFKGKELQLYIYDSTYYVDMSWINPEDVQLSENLNKHCTGKIVEPNVTDAQRAYTLTLAEDIASNNELGRFFSQQYKLHCK